MNIRNYIRQINKILSIKLEDISGIEEFDKQQKEKLENLLSSMSILFYEATGIPYGFKPISEVAKENNISRQAIHQSDKYEKFKLFERVYVKERKDENKLQNKR